ncbi:MAG: serine/threonine protein kinase, partial [Myxococcales bacterium]|nr:serine/threonine protein kinase [Myxococcales bacterium]
MAAIHAERASGDGCPDEDAVIDFIGGAMDAEGRARIERHIDVCGRCRSLFAALLTGESKGDGTHDTALGDAVTGVATGDEARRRDTLESDRALLSRRYRDVRRVGAGGMGVVYAAHDRELDREVAIKLRNGIGADRIGRARFLREVRVTAGLQHPSIVPVYELTCLDEERPYYTMKLIKGRTLAAAIAECATQGERLRLLDHFVDLCQALAYAHKRGIIHRDIKPANVMVGEFGETVVLDWGLAKRTHDDDALAGEDDADEAELTWALAERTRAGSLVGTPQYMSPEQARGELDAIDARSDTWSLGLVLYELLAGAPAFTGGSLGELLAKIQAGEVPSLRERCPELPRDLVAIVERALRVDPRERYADAGALADDVAAFRAGALVGAHSYTAAERLRRFLARHRHAVAIASIAALTLIIGGVAAISRVVDERDRAQSAEHAALRERQVATAQRELAERRQDEAIALLSDSLVRQAEGAAREGDTSAACLLAAEALSLGERADARGVLLGA